MSFLISSYLTFLIAAYVADSYYGYRWDKPVFVYNMWSLAKWSIVVIIAVVVLVLIWWGIPQLFAQGNNHVTTIHG